MLRGAKFRTMKRDKFKMKCSDFQVKCFRYANTVDFKSMGAFFFQIGNNISYRLAKNSSFFISTQWQKTTTGGLQSKKWSEIFGNTGVSMSF